MAIVIRNDKPQGRFFRYRADGAPKSVWVDGYSEIIVPELSDTSSMLNKVEKAKQKRLEKLSNSNTIARDLFESRVKTFKDVSNTIRWKPVVVNLNTGYNTYVFERSGTKYVFASPPKQSLAIGTDIRGAKLNVLNSLYDGEYVYNGLVYTINSSEIVSISNGENSTALTWNCVNVTYTATSQVYSAYTTGSTNIYDNGAQWFSSSAGTGTIWGEPFGGFHYSGDSVYVLNINSSGIIDYSALFASEAAFSAYTLYNQLGTITYNAFTAADDNPIAVNTQFYNSSELSAVFPSNSKVKYDVPGSSTNRLLTLSNGRIIASNSYVNGGVETVNQSGSTATTLNVYVSSTETVDGVGVCWFTDTELLIKSNATGTYIDFSQDPDRYIQVSNGVVTAAGDINWGGVEITYQGWAVRDFKSLILTIYTQQGDVITTVGTSVYANSDGTGSIKNGDYTYNDSGTNKTISIASNQVTAVSGGGR